jgi:hypothetical protein
MRKTGAILFVTIFCVISAATAQLANTKWKGVINSNGELPVIWTFKKTTVDVMSLPDSAAVESMTYKTTSGFLFITKVNGTSDCDNSVVGKYSYKIKKDSLFLKPIDDACTQRSEAISDKALIKIKK